RTQIYLLISKYDPLPKNPWQPSDFQIFPPRLSSVGDCLSGAVER
ncbi:unnamed protein product, partial [Brassica oleracea var. botrytis]